MASRTSKAHDAEVCALSNEHTEVHAKRKKILGKGTGGREGYLLFFRQGLANLSAGPRQSNLQICSNHLQTSAEKLGDQWSKAGEGKKEKWRASAASLFETDLSARKKDGAGQFLPAIQENSEEEARLFDIFLARIRKRNFNKARSTGMLPEGETEKGRQPVEKKKKVLNTSQSTNEQTHKLAADDLTELTLAAIPAEDRCRIWADNVAAKELGQEESLTPTN